MSTEETAIVETEVVATPAAETSAPVESVQQAADKAHARKMKALTIAGYTVAAVAVVGVAGSLLLSSSWLKDVSTTVSSAAQSVIGSSPTQPAPVVSEQAQAPVVANAFEAQQQQFEAMMAQQRAAHEQFREQLQTGVDSDRFEQFAEQQMAAIEAYMDQIERLHAPVFGPAAEMHRVAMERNKAQREQAKQRRAEFLKSMREAREAARARHAAFIEKVKAARAARKA
jgi:cytochrome c1